MQQKLFSVKEEGDLLKIKIENISNYKQEPIWRYDEDAEEELV